MSDWDSPAGGTRLEVHGGLEVVRCRCGNGMVSGSWTAGVWLCWCMSRRPEHSYNTCGRLVPRARESLLRSGAWRLIEFVFIWAAMTSDMQFDHLLQESVPHRFVLCFSNDQQCASAFLFGSAVWVSQRRFCTLLLLLLLLKVHL